MGAHPSRRSREKCGLCGKPTVAPRLVDGIEIRHCLRCDRRRCGRCSLPQVSGVESFCRRCGAPVTLVETR